MAASFATDNCTAYYEEKSSIDAPEAKAWCNEGEYFQFTSGYNVDHPVQVFYHCSDSSNQKPTLLMAHGFPTHSFDFRNVSVLLQV